MRRIGLVACSKTKLDHRAPAGSIYSSALFRKSLLAALDKNDDVLILSALHGLVPLAEIIEPYDQTLKGMPLSERKAWGKRVGDALLGRMRRNDFITFYSGVEYARPLRRAIQQQHAKSYEPLAGLSLGQRLASLRLTNNEGLLLAMERQIARQVRRLWRGQKGGRPLGTSSGALKWPSRGLYLFVERSELTRWRVVRVGTHAVSSGSKSTLWGRLSTHKGTAAGAGSHRSSIFRSHVGHALMAGAPDQFQVRSWGKGQVAPSQVRIQESDLEKAVSAYLAELRVLWLDIPDDPGPDSDRSYLERNLIGLYSRSGLLTPRRRSGWLGELSPDWRIASTGIWNIDHVLGQPDPDFPEIFERYVNATLGESTAPTVSLATPGWRQGKLPNTRAQMTFLEEHEEPNDVG